MQRKLTEASIPSLRTDKVQEDVFHTPTPGAGLRLHRDGRKVFFCLYYLGGQRRRHYFGEHSSSKGGKAQFAPEMGMSLKDFERAYAVLKGDLVRGIDPRKTTAAEVEAAKFYPVDSLIESLRVTFKEGITDGTVGHLLYEFLKYKESRLTPRGFTNYRHTARSYLFPLFLTPVSTLGETEIRSLLSDVSKKAPKAVVQAKSVLSLAFDYGREFLGAKDNPCKFVKVLEKKGKRDRWLPDSELATLFSCLPQLKDQKAADVYSLILFSMSRPGEACRLNANDIIFSNRERVWRMKGKNGLEHHVPVTGPIAEIIDRRMQGADANGFLFWDAKGEYPYQLKIANKQIREITGLDFNPHDLRRTGRTHAAALGVRDEVAEALLAHAKEGINGTYNIYAYWPERKAALKLWHSKLADIQEGGIQEKAA